MNIDNKTFFTALGFVTVILRDEPQDKMAERAVAIAKLIENFCVTMLAEETTITPPAADAATTMSRLFAKLINDNQNNKDLVRDAMAALEHCGEGGEGAAHDPSQSVIETA